MFSLALIHPVGMPAGTGMGQARYGTGMGQARYGTGMGQTRYGTGMGQARYVTDGGSDTPDTPAA